VTTIHANPSGTPLAAREQVCCTHCALPVPAGLIEADSERQFCCNGCRTVYSILHEQGLDQYYRVRDAIDAEPRPAKPTLARYEELDDPAFHAATVRTNDQGGCETELLLEGVHCAACVWLIERLPRVLSGVTESRVQIRTRIARVTYDPGSTTLSAVARALDSLGYPVHPARGQAARDARTREDRTFLIRVAVAGALAGNIMLLAVALYGGHIFGIDPLWDTVFRWVSMALGVTSLLWPGRTFFRGAMAALRTRTAHLDLPIAIALGAGGAWGVVNTVRGSGEIYFDSLAVLTFLLLVGRWVQHRQQRTAADEVGLMLTLTPTSATLVEDAGTTRRVPIESVTPGSTVEVAPGDAVPADGVVTVGSSSIDASLLTGESRPVPVGPGDAVAAGSVNTSSVIRVRVQAVGEHTRVARLMRLVSDASERKAPIVQLTDRIAGRFVVIVLTLAVLTTVFWSLRVDAHTALEHATALLIVTCPCALGLATPMAMSVALGRAARGRALVKSAAAIEALARPGTLILDKTGTITHARTVVADFRGPDALLPLAAALERHASHPLAGAIREFVGADPDGAASSDVTHLPGKGVRGTIAGVICAVGSPEFIADIAPAVADDHAVATARKGGLTPVVIWAEGLGSGVFSIGDTVREDSAPAIADLRAHGWAVQIASGDDPAIVARVAAQVGVAEARGRMSPEDKTELVTRLTAESDRPVIMVGDGVNDAAALAAATVGVAVHGGAEASLEAADIYLADPGVAPLVGLTHLARHTGRTIHLCLAVSIAYNITGASLAMAGMLNALIAAVIMPVSSIIVVSIAMRPLRKPGSPG
jgi:Cu2+-exporting ATPase